MEGLMKETLTSVVSERDGTSSSSHDSEVSVQTWDKNAERKLLWKIDLLLLPILFLFYMLSYLDRINIGNAAVEGLLTDLDLNVGNRFNISLFLFYVLYIPFEIPSNLLLKKSRPSLYLPFLMFCWGLITLGLGFSNTYQTFYGLRILLGLFEAGLVPGVIYVSSMYYKRHEFQKRLSLMFVATSFGGAFGGLLAYAISNLSGRAGLAAWRWIFIIEGAATSFIALLAPLVLVDWPDKCRFFNQEERRIMRLRLIHDTGDFKMDHLDKYAIKRILLDWKIYLGAFTYMGLTTSGVAFSFFLPIVLAEYGWTGSEAQIHTIPVYVVAIGLTLILSWLSDWLKHRYSFIMFCLLLATIGYGMLLNQVYLSRSAKYAACFLVACGGLCAGPLAIVYLSNNVAGHYKRAVSSAVQVSFAGFSGIIGSVMFLSTQKPYYPTGFGVGLGMAWVSGAAATVMAVAMWIENKKRDRGERDDRLSWPSAKLDNLGDYHPGFRFTL